MDWPTILGFVTFGILAFALAAMAELILALPMRLIAHLSGWAGVQEAYPEVFFQPRKRLRFCSIELNGMPYRSCAWVMIGEEFITLGLMFPFRAWHKPFSIPISTLCLPSNSRDRASMQQVTIGHNAAKLGLPNRVLVHLE